MATRLLGEEVASNQQTRELSEDESVTERNGQLTADAVCGVARFGQDGKNILSSFSSKRSSFPDELSSKMSKFAIDFDLIDAVRVYNNHSVFAFDGEMTYEGVECFQWENRCKKCSLFHER